MADNLVAGGRWLLPCGLSSNTRQYVYTSRDTYNSILSEELHSFLTDPTHSSSHYVVFHRVTLDTYYRDFDEEHCDTFIPETETALIEMKSNSHEVAHSLFQVEFFDLLKSMNGMERKLLPLASSTVEGITRKKEADQAYVPIRRPQFRTMEWPTIVVEVGYSENQAKLESDVDFWLSESRGEVKQVVTISVDQQRRRIEFGTWGAVENPDGEALNKVTYTNVVTQNDGSDEVKVTSTDPLVLRFEDIFLRPAQGPMEQDVVMTQDALKRISKLVWKVQFNDGEQKEEEEEEQEGEA